MGDECEVMGEHHSTVNKYTSEQPRIIIVKYMNINLKTTGCPTCREMQEVPTAIREKRIRGVELVEKIMID